jgi:hypothetical protein
MFVLANEMFNSPPVFAWVLPVFVRLQPGKEETFSPASRSRIFVEEKRSNRGSRGVAEREELVRLGRDEAESA